MFRNGISIELLNIFKCLNIFEISIQSNLCKKRPSYFDFLRGLTIFFFNKINVLINNLTVLTTCFYV